MINNKILVSFSVILLGVFLVLFSAIRVAQPNLMPKVYSVKAMAAENKQFDIPNALLAKGLMPNSPFYWSEMLQDKLKLSIKSSKYDQSLLMTTYSNKRLGMGLKMVNLGYDELGTSVILKAEKYLFRATQACKKIEDKQLQQQQILNLKNTFIQHQQILEELLRTMPNSNQNSIQTSLQLNKQTYDDILSQI